MGKKTKIKKGNFQEVREKIVSKHGPSQGSMSISRDLDVPSMCANKPIKTHHTVAILPGRGYSRRKDHRLLQKRKRCPGRNGLKEAPRKEAPRNKPERFNPVRVLLREEDPDGVDTLSFVHTQVLKSVRNC